MIKTMKPATEEEAELIRQKHEEGRKKRNTRNHIRQKKGERDDTEAICCGCIYGYGV